MAGTLDALQQARGHLGSAIGQSIDSDDQIIMNHMRAAHEILGVVIKLRGPQIAKIDGSVTNG